MFRLKLLLVLVLLGASISTSASGSGHFGAIIADRSGLSLSGVTYSTDRTNYSIDVTISEEDSFIDGSNDSVVIEVAVAFAIDAPLYYLSVYGDVLSNVTGEDEVHEYLNLWNYPDGNYTQGVTRSQVTRFSAFEAGDYNLSIAIYDYNNTDFEVIRFNEVITLEGAVTDTGFVISADLESSVLDNCSEIHNMIIAIDYSGLNMTAELNATIEVYDDLGVDLWQNFTRGLTLQASSVPLQTSQEYSIPITFNDTRGYQVVILVENGTEQLFFDLFLVDGSVICLPGEATEVVIEDTFTPNNRTDLTVTTGVTEAVTGDELTTVTVNSITIAYLAIVILPAILLRKAVNEERVL